MISPFVSGNATIEPIVRGWIAAANSDSLLTLKHDPNDLLTPRTQDRSILTHNVSSSLSGFLQSGSCRIEHYYDNSHPFGPGYFAVTPMSGSLPAIIGSGVPSGSTVPSGSKDTLIVISGSIQGWHVHAESQAEIAQKCSDGKLILLASYHR